MTEPRANTDVELARWQGMIDERTARSVERLDVINGDVRQIKLSMVEIMAEIRQGTADRDEWIPILKKLASANEVATGVADTLHERNVLGLTRAQRLIGALGVAAAFASLALRLAGVGG